MVHLTHGVPLVLEKILQMIFWHAILVNNNINLDYGAHHLDLRPPNAADPKSAH
jgi:hypothetical protein